MNELVAAPIDFTSLMTEEELSAHEQTITKGRQAFIEVGNALRDINQRGGYRFTYSTFADYARQRWGMSVSSAYNTMAASQVVENVQTFGQIDYTKAAALSPLKPEEQRKFVETHDMDAMTKRQIDEAVRAQKKAERERDEAVGQARSTIEENERLKREKNPAPQIEYKEVPPNDYGLIRRQNETLKMTNDSLRAELSVIKQPALSNKFEVKKRKQDLNQDARALASKIEVFIKEIAPLAYLSRIIVDADDEIRNEYEEALQILERWIFDVRQNVRQTSAKRSGEVIDLNPMEVSST